MSIRMVTCVLCGKTVSTRSTLSLEALGAGPGRACRTHEGVSSLQSPDDESFIEVGIGDGDRERINIPSFALAVRALCILYAYDAQFVLERLRPLFPPDEVSYRRVSMHAQRERPLGTSAQLSPAQLPLIWKIQDHIQQCSVTD